MANQEHLDILAKGIETWNKWREINSPHVNLGDLFRANLARGDPYDAGITFESSTRANVTRANLSKARLSEAKLTWADLSGADLTGTDLSDADMTNSNLSGANLSGANLSGAKLTFATMSKADLTEAHLSDADMSDATLHQANLTSANLSRANFSRSRIGLTTFVSVDLSTIIGLENVLHHGPSPIGIDTIYRSQGKIPEVFLRGAGVPEGFITYMKSLTNPAFEFYSCFIAYSSADHELAERLYADLQVRNVRCWFAPEDMKIGDRLRLRIDESIRLHQKLLLLLSETSVKSIWVEQEVETAIAREKLDLPPILFPIRLDDSVMGIETGWPALIKRTRHIGDFTAWENQKSYQKAFDRLLRDLKVERSINP